MNQTAKSLVFVGVAIVLTGLAVGAHYATRPREISDFVNVGTEFFPQFTDPTSARMLEVSAVEPDTGALRQFTVAYKDGLWRIPSHHDYPAEAAKRLSTTAASLRGVTRDSLIARRASQHAQYGVLDPLDDPSGDPESIGRRITLRDEAGNVLADYIIGKAARPASSNELDAIGAEPRDDTAFYVRAAGEQETYVAHLKIDLSTKFRDWIEPDLLKLDAGELRGIEIDHQKLEDESTQTPLGLVVQIVPVAGETHALTRDDEFAPWTLEGLNGETEQLNTPKVGEIVRLLDDMAIVGVRPKYQYEGQPLLTADLQLNEIPELTANPSLLRQVVQEVQHDLDEKGFVIATTRDEQHLVILSRRGQVTAKTNKGVVYTLHFGDAVVGDETEIEIGGTAKTSASPTEDAAPSVSGSGESTKQAATDAASQAADAADAAVGDTGLQADAAGKNRFVMIRVTFDPVLLGPEPTKPVEPTKPQPPAGYDEWKKAQEAKDDQLPGADPTSDQPPTPTGADAPPQPPSDVAQAADHQFKDYETALAAYESAQGQYSMDLAQFENDVQDRQQRMEAGQKTVKELNERFADWYYVISAGTLETLKLERSQLVEPKQPARG